MTSIHLLLALLVATQYLCASAESNQDQQLQLQQPPLLDSQRDYNEPGQDDSDDNDICEESFVIPEPYKSLMQTSFRLALTQSDLAQYVDADTALVMLGDAARALNKPATMTAAKVVAASVGALMPISLLYPNFNRVIIRTITDYSKMLSTSPRDLNVKTINAAINRNFDNIFDELQVRDQACRDRLLCYVGQSVRRIAPSAAQMTTRAVSARVSGLKHQSYNYIKELVRGLSGSKCSGAGASDPDSLKCIGSVFNTILRLN